METNRPDANTNARITDNRARRHCIERVLFSTDENRASYNVSHTTISMSRLVHTTNNIAERITRFISEQTKIRRFSHHFQWKSIEVIRSLFMFVSCRRACLVRLNSFELDYVHGQQTREHNEKGNTHTHTHTHTPVAFICSYRACSSSLSLSLCVHCLALPTIMIIT
jgi:hypothetical protein